MVLEEGSDARFHLNTRRHLNKFQIVILISTLGALLNVENSEEHFSFGIHLSKRYASDYGENKLNQENF